MTQPLLTAKLCLNTTRVSASAPRGNEIKLVCDVGDDIPASSGKTFTYIILVPRLNHIAIFVIKFR